MKEMIKYLLLFAIVFQYNACSSKDENIVEEFDVQFELPALMDVSKGGEYTFKVKNGSSPSTSDSFVLESEEGISFICPIIKTSSESFNDRTNERYSFF